MKDRPTRSVLATPFRVLVIGLDMGDGGLIRYWSRRGRLPNFASLLASGTWIEVETTAQVLHTSTWPTFATGNLPGQHGVYYPYQPKPGRQLACHIEPHQYGSPTFWKLADEQGRRCLVYDIPQTFPESGFGGSAIFDSGTWAWYGRPWAQPTSLLKKLRAKHGRYPLGFEAKQLGTRVPDAAILEKRLLRSVEYKRLTAQWLLERHEWDLAAIGFCETHPAGHYLWPAGVETVEHAGDDNLFQPLFNVYAALDRAMGELRNSLPADTVVMIVSGDGVCPNRSGSHLLPEVLYRLGYTVGRKRSSTAEGNHPSSSMLSGVKQLLPTVVKRRVIEALPWWLRDQLGLRIQAAKIDWARTRAFTLPTDLEGYIRVNLKGREPQGIVEPGPQYSELCQQIRSCLEELTTFDRGPAVRRVWMRNEIFPGPMQEHLPDIIVTWNNEAQLTVLESPRFGVIKGVSQDARPGTHSPRGFLLAGGPGIPRDRQERGHLADVAPTVLTLLGLKTPAHMNGCPLDALIPRGAEQSPQTQATA
jgi:predicted AlkP superfamily phosphohydrolase/phosphomutase